MGVCYSKGQDIRPNVSDESVEFKDLVRMDHPEMKEVFSGTGTQQNINEKLGKLREYYRNKAKVADNEVGKGLSSSDFLSY
jgi:hypothetical protein